jgi:hypothetical protein
MRILLNTCKPRDWNRCLAVRFSRNPFPNSRLKMYLEIVLSEQVVAVQYLTTYFVTKIKLKEFQEADLPTSVPPSIEDISRDAMPMFVAVNTCKRTPILPMPNSNSSFNQNGKRNFLSPSQILSFSRSGGKPSCEIWLFVTNYDPLNTSLFFGNKWVPTVTSPSLEPVPSVLICVSHLCYAEIISSSRSSPGEDSRK